MRFAFLSYIPTLFGLLAAHNSFAQDSALESTIESTSAVVREIATERLLEGVIEAVHKTTISAQTSGRIVEVNYDVDDFVEKDRILIRLDETGPQARLTASEADVSRARARLNQYNKSLKRAQTLFSQGGMSKSRLEAAEADARAGRATLAAATAVVAQMKEQLEYTVVRSPYAGVVVERHVEVGEAVNAGTPLMTGFSLEKLRVTVDVPQKMIYAVRKLRSARVIHPDPQQAAVAVENITVFPYANERSNTFTVRAEFSTPASDLFPGMLTKVAFVTGQRSALFIPESAVVYRSELVGAYVIDQTGAVQLRHIRPGYRTDDGMIEILAGLKAGEQVATDPIKAGVQIKRGMNQS